MNQLRLSCWGKAVLLSLSITSFSTYAFALTAPTVDDLQPFCSDSDIWNNKAVTGGRTISPEQCMAVAMPCGAQIVQQTQDPSQLNQLLYSCVFSALGVQIPLESRSDTE
ncbi:MULTISPECIES: hypothetical protein [Vibrio]|uniref:Secreted protein n=2 Tax=Vibrio TaxID=662 RepID=A0A7X4RUT9_9VIBR|nr:MULTISPECIES: hypothetical protein [Vibrio]MBF9000365.1 hypothetical protein [Vibrio nitrifigilis]MZI93625.1 hypothetical protein [Vibrio eleionomae]